LSEDQILNYTSNLMRTMLAGVRLGAAGAQISEVIGLISPALTKAGLAVPSFEHELKDNEAIVTLTLGAEKKSFTVSVAPDLVVEPQQEPPRPTPLEG
jgi:hypothetical protein